MSSELTKHLVTVRNPLNSRDVDQRFIVLLDWARKYDEDKATDDDIYVWWGKVRSPNRLQPMVRKDDVKAIGSELNEKPGRERHLYVTDYPSLYVGEALAIHEGDRNLTDRSNWRENQYGTAGLCTHGRPGGLEESPRRSRETLGANKIRL